MKQLVAIVTVALLAACGGPAPSASVQESLGGAESPSSVSSASPSASPPAMSARPPDSAFEPGWHGRVVADAVRFRAGPGTGAPGVEIPVADAPAQPVFLGTETPNQQVYVLDGPEETDGMSWYLVAPTDGDHFVWPQITGWMAAGDGTDTWLVEEEAPCPTGEPELADITYAAASWAVRLGCFGDRELTLQGWFPSVPAEMAPVGCTLEPRFLLCSPEGIMPVERDFFDPANVDRIDFALDPAAGLSMPEGDQWIALTGRFNHPAAAECAIDVEAPVPPAYDLNVLMCRTEFVAHKVAVLGP